MQNDRFLSKIALLSRKSVTKFFLWKPLATNL